MSVRIGPKAAPAIAPTLAPQRAGPAAPAPAAGPAPSLNKGWQPSGGASGVPVSGDAFAAASPTPAKIKEGLGDELKQWAATALGFAEVAAGDVGIDHLYGVQAYQFKMSDGLMRGSRIDSPEGYQALAQQGIKSIVDLRIEGKGDEGFGAQEAGLQTKRIPIVDNTTPTPDQVKDFLDFVSNKDNQPVYFHCEAGKGRTGVMAAAARMALEGWPPEKALAEAEKFGDSLVDQQNFILQFGRDLQAGKYPGYPLPQADAADAP